MTLIYNFKTTVKIISLLTFALMLLANSTLCFAEENSEKDPITKWFDDTFSDDKKNKSNDPVGKWFDNVFGEDSEPQKEESNQRPVMLDANHENLKSKWKKRSKPVFAGQYKVASDPAILKNKGLYELFYTCLDPFKTRTILCKAISKDGINWKHIKENEKLKGVILQGRNKKWDENLESTYVIKNNNNYMLFYAGYKDKGNPMKGFPAHLGVATSSDGVNFKRVYSEPILSPTKGGYDNDAIYSPTIIKYKNEFVMLYVGHCYTNCQQSKGGVTLLAATSNDGLVWKKREKPVIEPYNPSYPEWMIEGVAEPDIIKGNDGEFYLFFTGLKGEDRVLGMARSSSPFGPWRFEKKPIVTPTEKNFDEDKVLAPFVLREGNKVRMWYLGSNKKEHIAIGHAEATWPLY